MTTRIVTFLGLGSPKVPHYDPCIYAWESTQTVKTPIHDVATILGVEGSISLVVLGTDEVLQRWFGTDRLYETYLREALGHTRNIQLGFERLPMGQTERERWDIFQTVVRCLSHEVLELSSPYALTSKEKESSAPQQIFLDITHGFRSQPFFAASAVAFVASQRRRVFSEEQELPSLRILYAAFERDKEIAPVLELTQLIEVMAWDSAIDGLMRYGRSDDLESLLRDLQKRTVLSSQTSQGHDKKFPSFGKLGSSARTMADNLATARIPSLLQDRFLMEALKKNADDLKQWVPPLEAQLEHLKHWVSQMQAQHTISAAGIQASLHLADIYLATQRYSELSALLRETLISGWTLQVHTSQDQIMQPGNGQFPEQREHLEKQLSHLAFQEQHPGLPECFRQLADLRNDVQHCAYRNNSRSANKIRDELPIQLKKIRQWLCSETFINCSNHPISGWSEEQKQAVRDIGFSKTVDIPGGLPHMDPLASTQEIEQIADQLFKTMLEQVPGAVFLAGEYTLVASLLIRLQKAGIRCYAATTQRVTQETQQADGTTKRESLYRFAQWRAYPRMW